MRTRTYLMQAAFLCSLQIPTSVSAQQLTVHVPVGQGGSPTSQTTEQANTDIQKTPGGVAVVPAKKFQESYALSVKDMLETTPGVLAQPRWGEESRLSIRGSGLSRGFHLRGVTFLQDGIPLTLSDGSSDFQEIDPLMLQHVEVYRGGNGLRYGAATLGGAINFVTPTEQTTDYNALFRAEGGSFSTGRLHIQGAEQFDGFDILAAATRSVSEGFRNDQSHQNNVRLSGNSGIRLGKNAETRFYLAWNDLEQEIPGTITKDQVHNAPKTVPSINITNNYARDIKSLRMANRTSFKTDNGLNVEIGAYANHKDLYHPIFQVIDQDSWDAGTFGRLKGNYVIAGRTQDFTGGINLSHGNIDAKRFLNIGGNKGALQADSDQISDNLEIYGENRFHFAPSWTFITGIQGRIAWRDYKDNLNAANNDDKDYKSLNPKIGLMWDIAPQSTLFANISRSAEAPTYSELVQGTIVGFVPVDQQTAWTAEIGTRGRNGPLNWDATLYRAHVRDELLNYTTSSTVPTSTFNAVKTVHQGLELALGYDLTSSWSLLGVYTYSDFFFKDDPQYGDNDLAGAPPHHIRVSTLYEKNGFFIEPNVEWVPDAPWVDYANTMKADSYVLFGMNAGYDLNDHVSLFVDARNLTDEKKSVSFSTATDARTAATNVFYPVDGRSVYLGATIKF